MTPDNNTVPLALIKLAETLLMPLLTAFAAAVAAWFAAKPARDAAREAKRATEAAAVQAATDAATLKGDVEGVRTLADGHLTKLLEDNKALKAEIGYLREGGVPSPATTGRVTQSTEGVVSTGRRKDDTAFAPRVAPATEEVAASPAPAPPVAPAAGSDAIRDALEHGAARQRGE